MSASWVHRELFEDAHRLRRRIIHDQIVEAVATEVDLEEMSVAGEARHDQRAFDRTSMIVVAQHERVVLQRSDAAAGTPKTCQDLASVAISGDKVFAALRIARHDSARVHSRKKH